MKNIFKNITSVIFLTAAGLTSLAAQGKVFFPFVGDPSEPPKAVYTGSLKAGQDCLNSSPGNRVCLEIRAAAYFNLQDYRPALEDFTALIGGGQGTAVQCYLRGAVYNALGDYDKALIDLNRADGLSPNQKPLLFVRGHVYLMLNNPEAALSDFKTLPVGPWDSWIYYYRGLAYAAKKMDREAEKEFSEATRQNSQNAGAWENHGLLLMRLGKTAQGKRELAQAAKLDPASGKMTAAVQAKTAAGTGQPVKAAAKPAIVLPAAAAAWKRAILTGTGVSLESPQPFVLAQDQPDPLLENQTAYVLWTANIKSAFLTLTYQKDTERPTARQTLEESVKFDAGSYKVLSSKITELTFETRPAALLEGERYQSDGKTLVKTLEFCFGMPGELVMLTAVYPAGDPETEAVIRRIYQSLKKEGETIAETPKMPPADWQRTVFHGLSFETPLKEFDASCREQFSSKSAGVACYQWGKYLTLSIGYRQYSSAAPSIAEMVVDRLEADKEIEKTVKSGDRAERTTEIFTIPGADAGKLKIETGFGTAATHEEIVYVRRGSEVWEVRVYYFVRWKFDEEASVRIINSLKDAPPMAAETPRPPELTELDRYNRISKDLSEGKSVSDADIKWALQYEKNHPPKKLD